jgi:uncharacterized protein YuzE
MRTIGKILPDFIRQVGDKLRERGREDLADQIPILELDRWTNDNRVGAVYIYLSGQRPLNGTEEDVIGARHDECLELADLGGTVLVDIDNCDRLLGIEVMGRKDIPKQLKKVRLPSPH